MVPLQGSTGQQGRSKRISTGPQFIPDSPLYAVGSVIQKIRVLVLIGYGFGR